MLDEETVDGSCADAIPKALEVSFELALRSTEPIDGVLKGGEQFDSDLGLASAFLTVATANWTTIRATGPIPYKYRRAVLYRRSGR